jgi:hypothetical protein
MVYGARDSLATDLDIYYIEITERVNPIKAGLAFLIENNSIMM